MDHAVFALTESRRCMFGMEKMSLWKWEEITTFKTMRTPLYPTKAEKSWISYLCKRNRLQLKLERRDCLEYR